MNLKVGLINARNGIDATGNAARDDRVVECGIDDDGIGSADMGLQDAGSDLGVILIGKAPADD